MFEEEADDGFGEGGHPDGGGDDDEGRRAEDEGKRVAIDTTYTTLRRLSLSATVYPVPTRRTLDESIIRGRSSREGGSATLETCPIKLTPHVRTYYFGERLIPEKLGKGGMPDGRVAESWEVSDYREARATITNGPYAGRPFHGLVEEFPDDLVGEGWRGPDFPLLLKFLDASRLLPVHLHPDDETARRNHGEPHGKSEAWHVLWAAPGASILAGIKGGFSREDLYRAFKEGDFDRVMPRHEVRTGDTVYVPGGIIHAFGPDTLIAEIQQTSDLGQFVTPTDLYGERLDDETWDANINATLDELKTDHLPRPNPGLSIEEGTNRRVMGCAGPHFALERWTLTEPYVEPSHPRRCLLLSNVGEGGVTLGYGDGVEALGRAESCVLPAAVGEVRVVPDGGGGEPRSVLRPGPSEGRDRAVARSGAYGRGDSGVG